MELVVFVLIVIGIIWWLRRRDHTESSTESPSTATAPRTPPTKHSAKLAPQDLARQSDTCWIPASELTDVHGYRLPGGMVYVGSGLAADSNWPNTIEPALIDPGLPIDRKSQGLSNDKIGYWPSYASLTPQHRAGYLRWLAAGRPPEANIGYVFLFFYGLERRVLIDAQDSELARAEIPLIIKEVERLYHYYEENDSFRHYAGGFVAAARVVQGDTDVAQLTPPVEHSRWDIPLEVKLALGILVAGGKPIPGEWALAWVSAHPETRLRTPAKRCPFEFARLFLARYKDRYGDGMTLKPNKTRLSLDYRPARQTFGGPIQLDVGSLPDVTRLTAPVNKLRSLVDEVADDLDSYSRWIGRTKDYDSLAAAALLPGELAGTKKEVQGFASWIELQLAESQFAVIDSGEIVSKWPSSTPNKLTKRECAALTGLLEKFGFGIEPDVHMGGTNLSSIEKAVLFRLPQESRIETTDSYHAATLLLHLSAAVVTADGNKSIQQQERLERHLEQALHLSPAERPRLRAHLLWLLENPPNFHGIRKRCKSLGDEQKHWIGQFLIRVAGADGRIAPEELNTLTKIYQLLGIDGQSVFADVHSMVSQQEDDGGPVTIAPVDQDLKGYAVPDLDVKPTEGDALSRDKINKIIADTQDVGRLLRSVFEDEVDAIESVETHLEEGNSFTLAHLDESHSTLVLLLEGQRWCNRDEFNELASQVGLMPDGAIETINEGAFELSGEPLLEGDDPVEINEFVIEEWMNESGNTNPAARS